MLGKILDKMFGEDKSQGVVLIGFGTHMRTVLLPCLRILEIPVAAVITRNPDAIKNQALALGINKCFGSIEELKNNIKISAAIVCTNALSHPEIIDKLMPLNVPVFVEKPVAADTDKLRELINAIGIMGSPVMVGFQKRHAPAYRNLKKSIAEKTFGEQIKLRYRLHTGYLGDNSDFLLEVGIHAFDLIYYLLGRSTPLGMIFQKQDNRRCYSILLQNENGDSAALDIGEWGDWKSIHESLEMNSPGHCLEIKNMNQLTYQKEILEENNMLSVDGKNHCWQPGLTVPGVDTSSLYHQGYLPQLKHFFECAAERKSPSPELNDSLYPLEMVALIHSKEN